MEDWIAPALAQGHGDGVIAAAIALLEQAGAHPHQCRWRLALFEATLVRAPWADERALAAGEALATHLAAKGAPAAAHDAACAAAAADTARKLAMALHKLGARTLDHAAYVRALAWYALAVRLERRPAAAAELHYLWGELLSTLAQHEEAAAQLERAVGSGAAEPRARDAADALVFSLDRTEHRAVRAYGPRDPRLSPLRDRLVRACDAFVEAYPDHDHAPGFAMRAARARFMGGNAPDAQARLEALLRRWPTGEHAEPARALLQDATTPPPAGPR